LGNTLVSSLSYVHGDISTKYILGIPQGWSLGRGPVFFFWVWTGRTILPPAVCVRDPKGFRLYIRGADRLRSADCQVTPSGVIDPLRTSPEIPPGLLAYVPCVLELPPQVGVLGGIPPSMPAAAPSGGGVLLGTGAPGS